MLPDSGKMAASAAVRICALRHLALIWISIYIIWMFQTLLPTPPDP